MTNKTYLYHYSKEPFSQIKTLEQQGVLTPERKQKLDEISKKIKAPYPYYQSVSFFLEPPPLDIIHTLYPKDHHTWVNGQVLYEHAIPIDSLKLKAWELVETSLMDMMPPYPRDKDLLLSWWWQVYRVAAYVTNESGTDVSSLKRALSKHVGKTRDAYLKTDRSKSYQYASDVPHFMIYFDKPIPSTNIRKVVVGGGAYTQQSASDKYKPIESDEHKGWYIPEGYEYFLANRKGELMNVKTGYTTKGSADDRGYMRACIWDNDSESKQDVKVHRVICTAFHGPCPSDNHEVGHKDDDRANNAASNLYWTTRKENMKKQHTQQAYLNW